MRREEQVAVQGPIKKPKPNELSHRGSVSVQGARRVCTGQTPSHKGSLGFEGPAPSSVTLSGREGQPVPVAGITGTFCRNVLPERCDSVIL